MSETKSCPECAEDVGADDTKCRHCGAVLYKRPVPPPKEPAISCWRIPCFFLVLGGIVAPIAIPNLISARGGGNETGAIGALKTIGTAQSLFREADKEGDGNLDYGTLAELENPGGRGFGLVDSILGSGTKNGYLFEATYGSTTSEFIWFATARPAIPTVTGDRYYVTNHEGVTFYTSSGPFKLNSVNCTIPAGARPLGK